MEIKLLSLDDDSLIREISYLDYEIFPGNPWGYEDLTKAASGETDRLFVLTEDGAAVGYALLRIIDDAELLRIAVEKSMREKGCGSLLLRAVIELAGKSGAESLLLEVRKSNIPAIRLYENTGFEIIDVRKNYYSSPVEDALIMRYEC